MTRPPALPRDQAWLLPTGPDGDALEDPVVRAYKAGIDRTLLRENLRRTPTERVRNLMALQRLAAEARRAGRGVGR